MDIYRLYSWTSIFVVLSLWFLGLTLNPVFAHDVPRKEKILAEFYPYRQGSLQVEGIVPGMTINADNAQVAAAVLPPEVLKTIQAGDFEITVQPTTDVPLREEYIAATVDHADTATPGTDGLLQHYAAGLPFPVLDSQDPQAGLKLGWNLRYRDALTSHKVGEPRRSSITTEA